MRYVLRRYCQLIPESYTRCAWGGARCTPPDGCRGSQAFLELADHNSPWSIEVRLCELFEEYQDGEDMDEDHIKDTLQELAEWTRDYHLFKLNRHEINHELQQHFTEAK